MQVTQQMVSTLQGIVRIQCICRYMHSLSHANILQPPSPPPRSLAHWESRGRLVALVHTPSAPGNTKVTLFWFLLLTECPRCLSF